MMYTMWLPPSFLLPHTRKSTSLTSFRSTITSIIISIFLYPYARIIHEWWKKTNFYSSTNIWTSGQYRRNSNTFLQPKYNVGKNGKIFACRPMVWGISYRFWTLEKLRGSTIKHKSLTSGMITYAERKISPCTLLKLI